MSDDFAPLPLSYGLLERYRLQARQQYRPGLIGGHVTRRKGQSLEFREHVPYTLGDDVRHIDWRASARYGEWLVRQFVAEEQLTLVLSIDTRDTMWLPAGLPKLQIALWLAEAIAAVALKSDDRVILHRLFGKPGLVPLRGAGSLTRIEKALRRLRGNPSETNAVNLKAVDTYLPPTAVWLIITDVYFDVDAHARALARKIASVQDGLRWVIIVELDSWPHERAILGEGARLIEGPRLQVARPEYNIDTESLRKIEANMRTHKQHFFDLIRRAGSDRLIWQWPAEPEPDAATFFRASFLNDTTLQRLFMRDK